MHPSDLSMLAVIHQGGPLPKLSKDRFASLQDRGLALASDLTFPSQLTLAGRVALKTGREDPTVTTPVGVVVLCMAPDGSWQVRARRLREMTPEVAATALGATAGPRAFTRIPGLGWVWYYPGRARSGGPIEGPRAKWDRAAAGVVARYLGGD
jgi:hypothetical protein